MANVIVPLADCLFRLKKIKKRQVIKDESLFNVCNILFRQQIGPFFLFVCMCTLPAEKTLQQRQVVFSVDFVNTTLHWDKSRT